MVLEFSDNFPYLGFLAEPRHRDATYYTFERRIKKKGKEKFVYVAETRRRDIEHARSMSRSFVILRRRRLPFAKNPDVRRAW